ncbi:MAG: hypothetical protein ABSE82_13405 [Nitrososphaerales archaeon]
MTAGKKIDQRAILSSVTVLLLVVVLILGALYYQTSSQVSTLESRLSMSQVQASSQVSQISSLQSSVSKQYSILNLSVIQVLVKDLNVTFPAGHSSNIFQLATFKANNSGYIQVSGPGGGNAYYYIGIANALYSQNQTYFYSPLGPLVIPVLPGNNVIDLSYRAYGDIALPEVANITIVYYY